MPYRRMLMLVLCALVYGWAGCSYDMTIPNVPMQSYQPAPIPQLLDQVAARSGPDQTLTAGVRVVDITPYDRKAWIAGFGPGRKSHGVLDPVTARILFLDDGRQAVVLIALDLVGLMNPDVNKLRALITSKYPHQVLVMCTHNHQGPDPIGYWGPGLLIPVDRGVDDDWMAKTMQDIALGVDRAIETAAPARLAFAETTVEPGWSTNLWFPEGAGPKDDRMAVIRVEKTDGTALATVINWACHAESLLDRNNKISADFPGFFYQACEKRGGGTGIFLNGALGGMVTEVPNRWELRKNYRSLAKRLEWTGQMGDRLAELALATVKDAPRLDRPRIALRRAEVEIPMQNSFFKIAADNGILRVGDRVVRERTFRSEVYALDLGPATAAFVPGEPFPSLGFLLKAAMPWAKPPMVVGLANDELSYMMMPEQWNDKHYGYERSMSCGRETGRLVYEALRALLQQGH